MRILPVASGKGGVGKTTFALNLGLTLSKEFRTIVIDLDAGTSSIRNFLEMKINRDIYHFLKKDYPLEKCIVPLNNSLDPEGLFKNFYLIASPKGFIDEVVNLSQSLRMKMIRGINALNADYVIIDNKAGLDSNVLDFLPATNTGILIFTPQMKAATLTAAELARAIIFRICHKILNSTALSVSPDARIKSEDLLEIEGIIERMESGYNQKTGNFDDFFLKVDDQYQNNIILNTLRRYVFQYRIYFVLNQFDSVEESAENVVKPFVEKIYKSISSKISIYNLGWIVNDEEVRKSAEYGLPFLVMKHYKRKQKKIKEDKWDSELRQIMGIKKREDTWEETPVLNNEIDRQLNLLKRMYVHNAGKDPETNFDFIAARIGSLSESSIHECGMKKILLPEDISKILQL